MISVHVGLHKTGTTSIQAALGTSKGDIRRRQAYLRWTDLFVTDGTINEAAVPAIRRLSQRGWHCVVSSEGALGPISAVYPDAAPVARRLDELLADQDLQIIVYLRPQHEWAASAFTQHVKEGGTDHPREYVRTLLRQPHLHYTALVRDLSESLSGGRLIVRPYSAGMDAVADFFRTAGLGPVPPYLGHLRANESLSAESVSALRKANADGLRPDSAAAVGLPEAAAVRRSPLPEDCQQQLHDLFLEDWVSLVDLVGTIPGHDPEEFRSVVEQGHGWVPRPYVEAPAAPAASSAASSPAAAVAGPSSGERFAAWRRHQEFRLRHGPRQTLLKAMMRWS